MPIVIDEAMPLGPQLGFPDEDLGTNAGPVTLEQLHDRYTLAGRMAMEMGLTRTPDGQARLAEVATVLLPREWHETIAGFPALAGQVASFATLLPPEHSAEWLRGLLPPHTLAAAAAKGDVETIQDMANAIANGGAADAALQDQLARELMTADVCGSIAELPSHTTIGDFALTASRLHNLEHRHQVLGHLLTDQAIHTLRDGAIAAKPGGVMALGRAAQAVCQMFGERRADLADALLTPEACAAVAAAGESQPLAFMSMGARAMSTTEGFAQAMAHLAGESACAALEAGRDAMAMGHMLEAAAALHRTGHAQGQAVIQRLLHGPTVPQTIREFRQPEPALQAMEAACSLPEGPARQAALAPLAPLFSHEVMGTTAREHPQRLGAMTVFAMQLDAGPARDVALSQLVNKVTCGWVCERGSQLDKVAFWLAAGLLPDASARQTMQAVLSGNPTPWEAALARARPPTPRPPGPAGGASL